MKPPTEENLRRKIYRICDRIAVNLDFLCAVGALLLLERVICYAWAALRFLFASG